MTDKLGRDLVRNGYVVVPIPCITPDKMAELRAEFLETVQQFPEYIRSEKNRNFTPNGEPILYVLGAFAALSNPASFHNPFVRKLRQWAMHAAVPLFGGFIAACRDRPPEWMQLGSGDVPDKLEQLVDRMLLRPAGVKVGSESWHRDSAKVTEPGDQIFGGWINLDQQPQYMSCIRGTHAVVPPKTGFAKLSAEESARYNESPDKVKVEIPPGSMLIFYEHIVHEIVGAKLNHDMYRLFLGWRLTNSAQALHERAHPGELAAALEQQAVVRLKSDQVPTMYSANHWSYKDARAKLSAWSSATFHRRCLEKRTVKQGEEKDKEFRVVHSPMHSLADYGFDRYPAYLPQELALLRPAQEWQLPPCGASFDDKPALQLRLAIEITTSASASLSIQPRSVAARPVVPHASRKSAPAPIPTRSAARPPAANEYDAMLRTLSVPELQSLAVVAGSIQSKSDTRLLQRALRLSLVVDDVELMRQVLTAAQFRDLSSEQLAVLRIRPSQKGEIEFSLLKESIREWLQQRIRQLQKERSALRKQLYQVPSDMREIRNQINAQMVAFGREMDVLSQLRLIQ